MTAYGALDHVRVRADSTLFLLGELAPEEHAAFEAHLHGCPGCRAEVHDLADAAALAVGAPPADLLARLRRRIAGERGTGEARSASPQVQPWKAWSVASPERGVLVRRDEGSWQDTAIPGIRVRSLFVDEANDRVSMLVRMDPGTAYPAHRHGGAEECYVLEGDLLVGEYRMRAGDYQRLDLGSVHGVQSTDEGCLLFVVSSRHDELLEGRA